MSFRSDRRGQAIQIGAVLLLGAVVLSLAIYQATVVPDQNRKVEFKHSQTVQNQLQDVRNALVSTGSTGDGRSVSVTLGTQYPARIVAMNPSPPSGTLSTVWTTDDSINATVANAAATGETGDFWTGTNRSYNTGALVHRPGYNEYSGAPTTWYENSVLFNEFGNANLTVTGQRLIDDDRISLVTLNGSYYSSRSAGASVDLRAVSTSSRTVSVTNTTGSNVTITIPTRLTRSDWEELLAEEINSGHVVGVGVTPVSGADYRLLHVDLEGGVTYELDLARVGTGTGVEQTTSAYLTDVAGNGSTVPEDGQRQLTVEVRDALNNPQQNVRVVAGTRWDNSSVTPENTTTDGDGQVTLTYSAPNITGASQRTDDVQVSLNTSLSAVNGTAINGSTPENVTLAVRVDNSDGSGLGNGGGDSAYSVTWQDPSGQAGVTCPGGVGGTCTVNANETRSVTLQTDTSPTVDDGTIQYAVSDQTVGTVAPAENTTLADGTANTTFTPVANGTLTVFASGGGSGDRLTVEVVNATSIDSIGEIRTVTVDQSTAGEWKQVTFDGIYENPVVVAKPIEFPTQNDEPAYSRIRNVESGSFEIRIDEWAGQDGEHVPVNVSYLAFEEGTHELQNGSMIDVGTTPLSGGFSPVTYNQSFGSTPVVFSQSQTINDDTDVVTRHENVGTGGFDAKLQESEGAGQSNHGIETVGYIAIEQNQSINSGSLWEADTTSSGAVFGVGDYSFDPTQFYQEPFAQSFSGPPALIAQAQTENGGNTAWERYGTLNATDFRVAMDEETTGDGERNHGGSETVGYFAFERQGLIYENGTAASAGLSLSGASASDTSDPDGTAGDNIVNDGDTITISVEVTDPNGVNSVTADASDFGGPSSLSLSNTGGSTYEGAFDVDAATAGADGSYPLTITATNATGATETVDTNAVELDTTGPSPAPSNVVATPVAGGDIEVSFDDIDDGTATYSVRRSTTSGGSYGTEVGTVTDNDATDYVVTDTATTDGTTYYYVVVPIDATGNEGTQSAEDDAIADAVAPALSGGTRVDDTTIEVTLTDSGTGLDSSTIEPGDFTLTPGTVAGIDASSITDGDSSGTVTINLASPVDSDTVDVSLQSDGVDDIAGNTQTSGTVTVSGMDGVAPTIDSFNATNPSGRNVTVSIKTNESLSTITVTLNDSSDTTVKTLTESEFDETVSGNTYTYEATYTVASDDTYEATLQQAEDAAGNDGAAGQSDSVTTTQILGKGNTVVYQGLSAINRNGTDPVSLAPSSAQALGTPGSDVNGDGDADLPYIDSNGNLNVTDSAGNVDMLVDGSASSSPPDTAKAVMWSGSWNGSLTSVFYVSGSDIYRVTQNSSPTLVASPSNGADSVLGAGDIDSDGTAELLFGDDSQQVRYLEPGGGTSEVAGAGAGSNNGGIGVGQPFDFDGDGVVRVPIVDGSGVVNLNGDVEEDKTFSNTSAKKGSTTAADVDGDGELEVVYVGGSNSYIKYVDDPLGTPNIRVVRDSDGDRVTANTKLGVIAASKPGSANTAPVTLPAEISYVDDNGGDEGNLQSVDNTGSMTTYPTSDQIKGIGPKESNFDTDADLEIPYVNNSDKKIVIIDASGDTDVLATGGEVRPKNISVGNVDSDTAIEAVFVSNTSDELRHADVSDSSPTTLTASGSNVTARQVVGVEDFNADGDTDVVFLGTNNGNLKFLDDGSITDVGVNIDSAAVGQPADLDGDDLLEVPYVDDNNDITFVDVNGDSDTVNIGQGAAQAPLGVIVDRSGNGIAEVAYINDNNDKINWIDPVSGNTSEINEKADNSIGLG